MSKITLDPIISGYNLSKINSNFESIEAELNSKVLYRDNTEEPSEPNSMQNHLDMNSFDILNAGDINTGVLRIGGVSVTPAGLAGLDTAYTDAFIANLANTISAAQGDALVGVKSLLAAAIARTQHDKNAESISVKDFGAVGDGTTDDTAAIQAAINAAIPLGYHVYLPVGNYVLSGSGLSLTNAGAGVVGSVQTIGNRATLFGAGAGSSVLVWKGTTGTALTLQIGGSAYGNFSDFSILQPLVTKQGTGLKIDQTSGASFRNVVVKGFALGISAVDSFSLKFNNVVAAYNTVGLDAVQTSGGYPNDFTFEACNIANNTSYGASFENPTTLTFIGGSVEGNGSGVSGQGGLIINGNAKEGAAGLNCDGVYFEANHGNADVIIYDSGNAHGIHSFRGCSFNRISNTAFTTYNIVLYKSTAYMTKIVVDGCGFEGFGSYSPSAARPYIAIPTPFDTSWEVDYGTNYYHSSLEKPSFEWLGTGTGFTVAPSGSCKYAISNGVCTLHLPQNLFTGTSNSINFTITGLPAKCTPSQTVVVPVYVVDNGVAVVGMAVVSGTTIAFLRDAAGNNFTNTGTKTLTTTNITYVL